MPVSAVDCVQPALQHTREQLFRPFRFGQWSRLALVGILAGELHVGGCGFGNVGNSFSKFPKRTGSQMLPTSQIPWGSPPFNPQHLSQHLAQFIGLIIAGALVFMVLSFVFLYLNSVFRFVLFDAVLRRHSSIGDAWNRWRHAGGRYFLWQLVFQFALWMFLLIAIGVPVALALAAGWANDYQSHIGRIILGVVLLGGLFVVFALATAVVQVLAKDFLVPIMALDNLDFADGWHRLLGKMGQEKSRFTVYLLLKLVLSIAAGIIFTIIAIVPVLAVVVPSVIAVIAAHAAGMGWNVATISLAIIFGSMAFLLLFYLIAVVSVPATIFFPAYALHFLAARYPALDAQLNPAPPEPETPVAAQLPPTPDIPPFPESPPFEPPSLPPMPDPIA